MKHSLESIPGIGRVTVSSNAAKDLIEGFSVTVFHGLNIVVPSAKIDFFLQAIGFVLLTITSAPKLSHATAIKNIGRYLLATRNLGIILNPDGEHFECHVDASHAGDWKQGAAMTDPSTARSRTGYIICYANRPLQWCIQASNRDSTIQYRSRVYRTFHRSERRRSTSSTDQRGSEEKDHPKSNTKANNSLHSI